MPEPDLIDLFVAPLERAGVNTYMVSGSIAAIQYGEPRATLDVDIALLIGRGQIGDLPQIFPDLDYYCPPRDILEVEFARPNRGHFNVIHSSSGLKADFYPSRNHPYLSWSLQNRRRWTMRGVQVWVAPPEYVLLWKLEFFREGGGDKHLRDIRGMLEVSGPEIDLKMVHQAVKELGLESAWLAVGEKER